MSGNSAAFGGGMAFDNPDANIVIGNTISQNGAEYRGGGMYFRSSDGNILGGNTISANSAGDKGGGIHCMGSSMTVVNCTFSGNSAAVYGGGGIHICEASYATVANCILWGDSAPDGPEIAIGYTSNPSTLTVSYSDVEGGPEEVYVEPDCTLIWGPGNIDEDPLFFDADLRLNAGSPCIDAGDSTAVPRDTPDLDGDGCTSDRVPLDPDGNYRFHNDAGTLDTGISTYWHAVVDMGAYEYGATDVVPPGPCFADLNCDASVNTFDIDPFVLALTDPVAYQAAYPGCDIDNADCDEDGAVNTFDIDAFVALLTGG